MQRPPEELLGGRQLDDAAEVHHGDAVGDVADDGEVVRDEDVGQVELLLQLDEQVQHLRLDRDVERRDGLVGDDELRLQDERARQADALPLPAAELVRVAVGSLGRHADALEHVVHDRVALLARDRAVDREPLRDQVADLHARVERPDRVLEDDLHVPARLLQVLAAEPDDVDAVEHDLAGGRLEQAQDRPTERRLAAPGLADEPERLASADVEIDAVDGLQVAGRALEEPLADGEVLLQTSDAQQDVVALPDGLRLRLGDDGGLVHAHDGTSIPFTSRGPFSQSQQADCCPPASKSGGSSVAQRSKA